MKKSSFASLHNSRVNSYYYS